MTAALRRACAALFAVLACALPSTHGWAQASDWPSRPVRIVVPYPPGTGPDIMARLVGEKLAKELKSTFIVENKAGVNGSIGTEMVVRAPADGYTFLLVDRLTVSVNPLLYKLNYDPRKDLASVSNIADVSLYLVVSAALPVTDFKSFVSHVKANPGRVTFGSGGVGSIMHLNMVLLEEGTGTSLMHVPYKAFAEVIPAMLSGEVNASSGGVEALQQHVAQGKLRLLAVGAPSRTTAEPNVPTIVEAAGGDYMISTSYSMHARAGTPPDVMAKLQGALQKVLADAEVQGSATKRGLKAYATTPSELDRVIGNDSARIGKLVRDHNIKVQ
ncbi:MAG: tripartite tricarboxylate transporter substrate binding protein [Burkholderiaceae bacterium]|nr:tripartite tricarboxylate transporter substrate binding protein [Burkholderiaceae bacterium]